VLPLPFKVFEIASGRDKSPRAVKIEELAGVALMLLGLPALHAYAYGEPVYAAGLWRAWVAVTAVVSVACLFLSPKVRYAQAVMGVARTRAVLVLGTLAYTPMLVGVLCFTLD
jgi:hypothetical protein